MPAYIGGPLAMRQKYLIILEFTLGILWLICGFFFFQKGPMEYLDNILVVMLGIPFVFNIIEGIFIGMLPAVFAAVFAVMNHITAAIICFVIGCINLLVGYIRYKRTNEVKRKATLLNMVPPEQLLRMMQSSQ